MKKFLRFPADSAAGAAPVIEPPVTRMADVPPPAAPAGSQAQPQMGLDSIDTLFDAKAAEPAPVKPAQEPAPKADTKPTPEAKEPADVTKAPDEDDGLSDLRVKPPEKKKEEPKAEDPKKDEPKKDDAKPEGQKKDEPKKDEDNPQSPNYRSRNELKRIVSEVNAKNLQLTRKLQELETKSKEGPAADAKALTSEIERLRTENQQMEKRLMEADFTRSNEFKSKYQAPVEAAIQEARAQVEQLEVIVPPTEEGGSPTTRQATMADFRELFEMPPGKVDAKAQAMFGASAHRVVRHIDTIRQLDRQMRDGVQNAQKLAEEAHKNREAKDAEFRQVAISTFHGTTQSVVKEFPEFFAESQEDPQGTELLKRGLAFVDRVYSAQNMPPEQRAKADAVIRLRAGAFPRVIGRLRAAEEELNELRSQLKQYTDGGPKTVPEGQGKPVSKEKGMIEGIDDLPLSQPR